MVCFQLFLQVCIILTGNYNFFNLLTMVLCVSLLDDEYFRAVPHKKNSSAGIRMYYASQFINVLVHFLVLYASVVLFNIRWTPNNTLDLNIAFTKQEFDWALSKASLSDLALIPLSVPQRSPSRSLTGRCPRPLSFTKQEFDWALSKALPAVIYVGLSSLTIHILKAVMLSVLEPQTTFAKLTTVLSTVFYSAAALFIFGISIVPFSTLHPVGNTTVIPAMREWHTRLDHLHLTNSYGLFRRMTGVGGRPEVIIVGSNNMEGPWKEYNFLYKPGNVNNTPPFVGKDP
uniref:Lipase maturation factor n=1 Tax=Timema douglasi TaxID=61478 RepID=A0A7R8VW95_TIMDO|nr:unnamed protein product [Timema douglasi]